MRWRPCYLTGYLDALVVGAIIREDCLVNLKLMLRGPEAREGIVLSFAHDPLIFENATPATLDLTIPT